MCINVPSILLLLVVTVLVDSYSMDLYEGDKCSLEYGAAGVCMKLTDCPPRMAEVLEGKRESGSTGRCGFDDFTEIVCCPVKQKLSPRAAEVACQQYDKEIPPLKIFDILGGVPASSTEFPYMVALGYENNDTDDDPSPVKYNCCGSLISRQHVLTAAHCVYNINEKVPIEVRLGYESIWSTPTNVQRIPISDIIFHPEYRRSLNYNDVAILKLKTKVQFSNTVKPICLQTKPLNSLNVTSTTSLVVLGWGATGFGAEKSIRLMRTPSLSIVDRAECAKMYTGFGKLPNSIDDSMICMVDSNKTRRADACQGESGGPLLMLTNGVNSVIGITAFGQACGGPVPGVYIAVHPYLDWIEDYVWPTIPE